MSTKTGLGVPASSPAPERLVFVKKKGRYTMSQRRKIENSLLAAVGFLEFANAGDFAANVWNNVPVPTFAVVLMALGGIVALAISCYAFTDARLSWANTWIIQSERRYLQRQRVCESQGTEAMRDIDCQLDVTFRELGSELIDRVGMDILLGFGAILVGIGTFLAIGGADPKLYRASNLMTGYIGNAPAAIWGFINALWFIWVWRRAERHRIAAAKELGADDLERLLKDRVYTVKLHAATNGTTGFVAGAASLVTATMWWGYVVLIPCIVSSMYCNYIWRRRIGYARLSILRTPTFDKQSLIEELRYVTLTRKIIKDNPLNPLESLVTEPESIEVVMGFVVKHGLFEDFCLYLLESQELSAAVLELHRDELEIEPQRLVKVDEPLRSRLLEIAEVCVREMGIAHFQDRQRYLLETLGCYLCSQGPKSLDEK